jgi:hypothetical protein
MSFDIFLSVLRDGDEFDRSIVERAFASMTNDLKDDDWSLHDQDGEKYWGTVLIENKPAITGFSVNRPPFTPEFWNAISEVLRQTPTALVWPGYPSRPSYCVANPDFAANLPADYVETWGPPAFVTCGAEIEAAIEFNS